MVQVSVLRLHDQSETGSTPHKYLATFYTSVCTSCDTWPPSKYGKAFGYYQDIVGGCFVNANLDGRSKWSSLGTFNVDASNTGLVIASG